MPTKSSPRPDEGTEGVNAGGLSHARIPRMKVLLLSTSDRVGGAAIGAYRLHRALRDAHIDSHMLVLYKTTADPTVHAVSSRLTRMGRARRRLAQTRHNRQLSDSPRQPDSAQWSLNLYDHPIAAVINRFGADVVHAHWVGDNFLPMAQLAKIHAPLVFTLRDPWLLTGGCHYFGDCRRYMQACGNCPQLLDSADDDLSARVFRDKQRAFAQKPPTVVALGEWAAARAGESALLADIRIDVIGNAIDGRVFKPLDRAVARRAFNLPLDKRLLLFGAIGGASDLRKGFAHLRAALAGMDAQAGIELVVFGGQGADSLDVKPPLHQVGTLADEISMCLLYSACDVFALPSLQDTSPKTVMEALACGTPCVAFDGSGAADMIAHQRNGCLARLEDADDLRAGINWTLAQEWDRQALHEDIMARFGAAKIAKQHIQLYESLR